MEDLLKAVVEKIPPSSIRVNPRFDQRESAMPARAGAVGTRASIRAARLLTVGRVRFMGESSLAGDAPTVRVSGQEEKIAVRKGRHGRAREPPMGCP